jgi:hypothetical protein
MHRAELLPYDGHRPLSQQIDISGKLVLYFMSQLLPESISLSQCPDELVSLQIQVPITTLLPIESSAI